MEIERHPHGVLRLDAAYVLQEQPIAAPMSARAAEMRLGCGKLPATSVRVSLTQTPAIFKTMVTLSLRNDPSEVCVEDEYYNSGKCLLSTFLSSVLIRHPSVREIQESFASLKHIVSLELGC